MPFKPVLLSGLEAAINRYLALDEDAPLFLQPLAGKVIAINILPFNLTFYLCPSHDNIQIIDTYLHQADTTLTGTPAALGLMSLSSTPMRSVFSGQVIIEGDTETARKFQQLFDNLDIDLEEQLSHFTGDIIAHQLGRIAHTSHSWTQDAINTLQLNLSEFLQEETRDLPAQPEIEIFFRQVDTLRADFDRLQIRLERLALVQTN